MPLAKCFLYITMLATPESVGGHLHSFYREGYFISGSQWISQSWFSQMPFDFEFKKLLNVLF